MDKSSGEVGPTREERLAHGMGLVAQGYSFTKAADAAGVPRGTLYDNYVKLLGPDRPNAEEERRKADERLLATAYSVATQGLERMASEIGEAEHRTVTAWTEVSSRALSRLRGWDKGIQDRTQASAFGEALGAAIERGGFTLTVEPIQRSHGVIDATSTREPDGEAE